MNSMKIGQYQMDEVFDLVLPEYTIPAPVPQTKMVQIIGHNGDIDLSNAYGETKYQSRKWTLDFKCFNPEWNWHTMASNVMNSIHGERLDFSFDDDPDYYWNGRVSVKDYTSNNGEGTLRIEIVSDPFKMSRYETVMSIAAQGTITLTNYGKKTVIPSVSSTNGAHIRYTISGTTYTAEIPAGGNVIIPSLILRKNNPVLVELLNSGEDASFSWRVGEL